MEEAVIDMTKGKYRKPDEAWRPRQCACLTPKDSWTRGTFHFRLFGRADAIEKVVERSPFLPRGTQEFEDEVDFYLQRYENTDIAYEHCPEMQARVRRARARTVAQQRLDKQVRPH